MQLDRRMFVAGAGCAALAALVPLRELFGRGEPSQNGGTWGPLERDPRGILDLPAGFTYRVIQRAGTLMTDGYQVPGAPDGMGCFSGPGGTLVLMRNHENTWFGLPGPYPHGRAVPKQAYDPAAQGGVTRVVLDAQTLEVRSSNLVLTGTLRNCAGGISPWGWLSCEEATDPEHGFVFLCPQNTSQLAPPRRLTAYGRFRHEAACVDPNDHVAFLTEDQPDGCLYRFVPTSPSTPFSGRLEALRVLGEPERDLSSDLAQGDSVEVDWVVVDQPNPVEDTVRLQARARGAALLRRGEGIWYAEGTAYLTATTGGPVGKGQVFALTRGASGERDRLTLIAQSTSPAVLDMPDNLTIAPSGDIVIAEDALGGEQFVRFIDHSGRISDFARNALSRMEIAGVCFSPDGHTLFMNLYGDGLTLAIRGPFVAHAAGTSHGTAPQV